MDMRAFAPLVAALVLTTGCAAPRTIIDQRLGLREARVQIGKTRLMLGDRVTAYRVACAPVRRSRSICFREHHGEGVVTRLEGDVAFVHFPQGGRFAPRDRIIRIARRE